MIMKKWINVILIATVCTLITGCNSYGTDNTPKPTKLNAIDTTVHIKEVWSASSGSGVGDHYLKLGTAFDNNRLFVADAKGALIALDANTGSRFWRISTKLPITAGPTASAGLVIVGTSNAIVTAFNQQDGKLVWQITAPSEVLAAPAISGDIVIIKTIDGQLTALDVKTGALKWHYQEDVPSLILRGSSSVVFDKDLVIAGFENGKVIALDLVTGKRVWQKAISTPLSSNIIANMVDIDATPIIQNGVVFAASYQGNIMSLGLANGQTLWEHTVSTFSGIAANAKNIFVSEADSSMTAFDAATGSVVWTQKDLLYRKITGPVVFKDMVVVGDAEGFLHFMSQETGKFVAREKATRKGILATPLVVNDTLYINTTNGYVIAYRIKSS